MQELVVVVNTADEIFNAPAINPFSENELEVLGLSGLDYIRRQLQKHRRDWKNTRLRVRLPPDQITPGFEDRLREAVRRYCRAKIEDDALEIHLIRFRSSIGLGILLALVAAIIVVASLLFTGPLAGAPQAVQLVVAATISLFAWVSLWDPLEALLFNPIAYMREDFILRKIAELELVVEALTPDTSTGTTVAAHAFDAKSPTPSVSQE